jgi:anti-sigma regulatory factor (Ser/Thr protein kinase)
MEEDALIVQVTDTGGGFDLQEAKQQSEERRHRGESKRGWGLQIMEELMDEVRIESTDEGTVITMVKKR